MKKIILFVTMLIVAVSTFSQQTNPSPALTKQDYMQKSKKQKTTAWVLLSVGVVCTGIGSFRVNPDGPLGDPDEPTNSNSTIFLVTGLTAIGTSIPLFIASSKNKKKAASLAFKYEPVPQLLKSSFVYRSIPAVNIKISL